MVSFRQHEQDVHLSFKETKTHKVLFDPDVDIKTFEGRDGEYDAIPVGVDGNLSPVVWLGIKNKTLYSGLKKIAQRSVLEITQSGSGYDTSYSIKVLEKKPKQADKKL